MVSQCTKFEVSRFTLYEAMNGGGRALAPSWRVVCLILRLAVLVDHRLVTDRQTDRHRQGHRPIAYTALA